MNSHAIQAAAVLLMVVATVGLGVANVFVYMRSSPTPPSPPPPSPPSPPPPSPLVALLGDWTSCKRCAYFPDVSIQCCHCDPFKVPVVDLGSFTGRCCGGSSGCDESFQVSCTEPQGQSCTIHASGGGFVAGPEHYNDSPQTLMNANYRATDSCTSAAGVDGVLYVGYRCSGEPYLPGMKIKCVAWPNNQTLYDASRYNFDGYTGYYCPFPNANKVLDSSMQNQNYGWNCGWATLYSSYGGNYSSVQGGSLVGVTSCGVARDSDKSCYSHGYKLPDVIKDCWQWFPKLTCDFVSYPSSGCNDVCKNTKWDSTKYSSGSYGYCGDWGQIGRCICRPP